MRRCCFTRYLPLITLHCLLLRAASSQAPLQSVCEALPKVAVADKDKPTIAEMQSLGVLDKGCFGSDFYYGNGPNHFRKARWCVLAKLGMFADGADSIEARRLQLAAAGYATDPADLYPVEGLVLAMMYANGEGVPRNPPLARQFLCTYGSGIDGESEQQLLADLGKAMAAKKHYDVCAEDGLANGRTVTYFCRGMKGGKAEHEAGKLQTEIRAKSDAEGKLSFAALVKAWKQYDQAYNKMAEVECTLGTGCGMVIEAEEVKALSAWEAVLQDVRDGKAPAGGANEAEFTKVDRELNDKYRSHLKEWSDPCIQGECAGPIIRDADRAWLKYREAWVVFGKTRWPEIPADQWRSWQTKEWTALLSGGN